VKIVKNKEKSTNFAFVNFLIIFSLLTGGPFSIAPERQPNSDNILLEPKGFGPTDSKELEGFLDNIFTAQMKRFHVPGAVFILVKDGEIFFAKGYGYADLDDKISVDSNRTVFHGGSISKVVTATAVMQLVERGLVDLNEDVNTYLKRFKLEKNYLQPVTLAHLLTHTGGIEWRGIGTGVRSQYELIPLGEYLGSKVLYRVAPPGEVIIYSSIGMALAGYIVEEVSDVPFAQYIDENIFQPLGMNRSSFKQPPPPHITSDVAVGYAYKNGDLKTYTSPYLSIIPPAGDFFVNAADIARFMIAHLQDGRYGDVRILEEATVREMHRQQFAHHPELRGRTYGFSEWFENDKRAIFHDGSAQGFNARLFLLLNHNLGFFVAWNNNSLGLKWELTSQFLDRYYPVQEKPIPPQPSPSFRNQVHRFTGYYRDVGYNRHTIEKLTSLLGQIKVTANSNGTLRVFSDRLVQVEPFLFQWADSDGYVVFREDNNGDIAYMLTGSGAYEKLPWYETVLFQLTLIGIFILVFLSGEILWPFGYILRCLRKKYDKTKKEAKVARILAGLIGLLNLVFLMCLGIALLTIDQWEFVFGIPSRVIALLVFPIITSILTIALLIFNTLAWKNKYWGLLERLHYSLITLACIGFIPFLLYWNLLGFRY
jgi:CubicO group peptidase (beta-lactamase class C family)